MHNKKFFTAVIAFTAFTVPIFAVALGTGSPSTDTPTRYRNEVLVAPKAAAASKPASVSASPAPNRTSPARKPAADKKPVVTPAPSAPSPAPATPSPKAEPAPEPVQPAPAPSQSKTYTQLVEQEILRLTNIERIKQGLSALALDTQLSAISREHSADMAAKKYFDHVSPSGCSSACRAGAAGYSYTSLGENIYLFWGQTLTPELAAQKIVLGWMNSAGHRANILGNYTKSGIGIYAEGTSVYATAMYSLPR